VTATLRMLAPLRPAARILTGSTYVRLGFDALRAPGGRVDLAAPVLAGIRKAVPLPDDDEMVVRANAAVAPPATTIVTIPATVRVRISILPMGVEHLTPSSVTSTRLEMLHTIPFLTRYGDESCAAHRTLVVFGNGRVYTQPSR